MQEYEAMGTDNDQPANLISDNQILIMSLSLLTYFSLLYLNSSYWHLDYILIGVVQELITIPMIIGTFVLFGLTARHTLKSRFSLNIQLTISLVALSSLVALIVISFL